MVADRRLARAVGLVSPLLILSFAACRVEPDAPAAAPPAVAGAAGLRAAAQRG
jgi:hypothetical protein